MWLGPGAGSQGPGEVSGFVPVAAAIDLLRGLA